LRGHPIEQFNLSIIKKNSLIIYFQSDKFEILIFMDVHLEKFGVAECNPHIKYVLKS